MSYCRFENTARDLRDCLDAIENGAHTEDLNSYERNGLEDLLSICETIFFMKEEIEETINNIRGESGNDTQRGLG